MLEKIDIYDIAYSKWYSGEVIELKLDTKQVKVHYDGYSSNYDEYIERISYRLAPLNRHTAPDPFWSTFTSGFGTTRRSSNYYGISSWYGDDDSTPPTNNGCVGLRNLGNTCFMNSTIQCLSHCPLFVNYFLNGSLEINKENPLGWQGKVAETWSNLLSKYWSSKYCVLSPTKLKTTIAEIQPRFSGYQQHDSSELLQFLLDGLHEDLNRILKKPYIEKIESNNIENDAEIAAESWNRHKARNDSIIVDLIQGQLKSRVECPDCNRISVTFDPFMFLSVPLPTEKKYVIKIINVIYLDLNILPKKFAIKLPSISSISDLNDQIEIKQKIPKNRLVIAECWNNKIYKIFKNYESIDQLSDNEKIICYEIPTDKEIKQLLFDAEEQEPNKFTLIPIYHQIIKQQQTYYNYSSISNECIGIPLLMKLPVKYDIDTNLILQYIIKIIKPYCQNFEKWDCSKQKEIDIQIENKKIAIIIIYIQDYQIKIMIQLLNHYQMTVMIQIMLSYLRILMMINNNNKSNKSQKKNNKNKNKKKKKKKHHKKMMYIQFLIQSYY